MRIIIGALAALAVSAGAAQAQERSVGRFELVQQPNGCSLHGREAVRDREPLHWGYSIQDWGSGAADYHRLILTSDDWTSIETDRPYPLTLQFDGSETIRVTGHGDGEGRLIEVRLPSDFAAQASSSAFLTIRRDGSIVGTIDLTDAAPAIRRLEACAAASVAARAARSDPRPRDPFAD